MINTRTRLTAVAAVVSMIALAVPAAADAKGKPGGQGGGSSSVSLVMLDPAAGGPTFGDQVTFAVNTTVSTTWVDAKCYQNGQHVYSETRGFFPDYPWGQTYTLGPTTMWTGGAATCTAELYTLGRKNRVSLATTAFEVGT